MPKRPRDPTAERAAEEDAEEEPMQFITDAMQHFAEGTERSHDAQPPVQAAATRSCSLNLFSI